MPLACPSCDKPMKGNDINKKMWNIHHMCFDCVVKMEAKIKLEGKWDKYERGVLNANKNSMVDDFETAFNEFMNTKSDSYFSE